MPPMANNEHQRIVGDIYSVLTGTVGEFGTVLPGANVSDQEEDWEKNYRCPDVLFIAADGRAVDRGTYWFGGPDFVVEVMSPGDDTMAKLPFYAGVGVREVLVVERDTRVPTLYRLGRNRLTAVRPSEIDGEPHLVSAVVPLAFRAVESKKHGPRLEVRRTTGRKKVWLV